MKVRYHIGILRAELYFRGARTLKDRRGHLISLKDRLRNTGFAVAQVGPADLVQQAWIAAVFISGSRSGVRTALDRAGDILQDPAWELVSMERDIVGEYMQLPGWEIQ
jgi:uncharacterized protein YlxP (DUF503 family)